MKKILAIVVCLGVLSGCRERFAPGKVQAVPGDKVTTTVTETTKVERPVPVYRIVPSVTTKTKTYTNDGKPAEPLHDATIKAQVLEAK